MQVVTGCKALGVVLETKESEDLWETKDPRVIRVPLDLLGLLAPRVIWD
jgi:hypothetical protein